MSRQWRSEKALSGEKFSQWQHSYRAEILGNKLGGAGPVCKQSIRQHSSSFEKNPFSPSSESLSQSFERWNSCYPHSTFQRVFICLQFGQLFRLGSTQFEIQLDSRYDVALDGNNFIGTIPKLVVHFKRSGSIPTYSDLERYRNKTQIWLSNQIGDFEKILMDPYRTRSLWWACL